MHRSKKEVNESISIFSNDISNLATDLATILLYSLININTHTQLNRCSFIQPQSRDVTSNRSPIPNARYPIPNARYSSSDRAARFPDRQYVSRASPPLYAPTSYHHSSGSPADYARHNHHHHHPPAPPPPSSHHHHHPADPFYSSSRARRGDDAPYSVPRRYAGSPPPPSSSSAPHHRL